MRVKEGDYVRIVPRECTAADLKAGTFYRYFCGLCGIVDHIYDDKEICVRVDLDTLPDEIRQRHIEIQESIKKKWLNSLSAEGRNRLSPEEKRFELSYTILVQSADLEKVKKSEESHTEAPRPVAIKSAKPLNAVEQTAGKVAVKKGTTATTQEPQATAAITKTRATAPKTKEKTTTKGDSTATEKVKTRAKKPDDLNDLTPAELAFLREREKVMKRKK